MAQETLDYLTNPVIAEVWTLRPREQRESGQKEAEVCISDKAYVQTLS